MPRSRKITGSIVPIVGCLLAASCGPSEPAAEPKAEVIADSIASPAQAPNNITVRTKTETAAERKARLREKAKTDPEGADAEAISHMGRNELVATAINSAGYLCARVTDMYPSGADIIVHCVEYRSGEGRVKYRVNARAGTVEPM